MIITHLIRFACRSLTSGICDRTLFIAGLCGRIVASCGPWCTADCASVKLYINNNLELFNMYVKVLHRVVYYLILS